MFDPNNKNFSGVSITFATAARWHMGATAAFSDLSFCRAKIYFNSI